MGILRLIDGGQRTHDEPAAPSGVDLDDEATVVAVPAHLKDALLDDEEVEDALAALGAQPAPSAYDAPLKWEPPVAPLPPAMAPSRPSERVYNPPRGSVPLFPDPSQSYNSPPPALQQPPTFTTPPPGYLPQGLVAPPGYVFQAVPTGSFEKPSAPRSGREGLKAVLVVAGIALGIAFGWVLFAGKADAPATTPAPPTAAAVPTVVAPSAHAAPTPAPAPVAATTPVVAPAPKPTKLSVEISSLEHPVLDTVASTAQGEISAVALRAAHDVKPGETLFLIRSRSGTSAKVAALTKRITELTALAQQDPDEYEPFLTRARRDLDRARQPDVAAIKAGAAGLLESRVKVGQKVDVGTVLAARLDTKSWVATVTVAGSDVTPNWSCAVADDDGTHTATCKIQTTELAKDGTSVTVEIAASQTPWLTGVDQHPRLILEPLAH